jgi:hypothetical protein
MLPEVETEMELEMGEKTMKFDLVDGETGLERERQEQEREHEQEQERVQEGKLGPERTNNFDRLWMQDKSR